MDVLRVLPDPAYPEFRAMIMALGPHATPGKMTAAFRRVVRATRKAPPALLINRAREAILATGAENPG